MKVRVIIPNIDNPENLTRPPHVLSQCIAIVNGKYQVSPQEQKQRWSHLADCIYCQVFLGNYLLGIITHEGNHNHSVKPAYELLSQLMQIMHSTIKEDIPAYVKTLVDLGKTEASCRFPLFTDHVQSCQDCQVAVQHLEEWLRQLKQVVSIVE